MSGAAGVRLRRARPEDVPQWLALEALFPSDRMSARSLRRLIQVPSAHLIVAMRGRDMLGNLVLLTRAGSQRARIYSLIVSPDARGLGLGSRLVRAAEAQARAAGCTGISLEVRGDNHAALTLYRKLGYRQSSVLPAYYEDGADGLRLDRSLTESAAPPRRSSGSPSRRARPARSRAE